MLSLIGTLARARCPSLGDAIARQARHASAATEEDPQDMYYGEAWAHRVVEAVLHSPAWPRTLLIYTYDEHGGYYDHVPPPAGDPARLDPAASSRPATRPAATTSTGRACPPSSSRPTRGRTRVTDVVHDHTSVLATIEAKWNLPALTYRDANAATVMDFLDAGHAALHDAAGHPWPVAQRPIRTGGLARALRATHGNTRAANNMMNLAGWTLVRACSSRQCSRRSGPSPTTHLPTLRQVVGLSAPAECPSAWKGEAGLPGADRRP